jgi:hypothetical protein
MRGTRQATTWLAAVSLAAHAGMGAAQTSETARIPTVSRLVMQFTEREIDLATRIRAGDAQGAGRLLTDDFELRAGPQPGRPVPRDDWLRQSIRSAGPMAAPMQMAVHDLGDTMVVSFLQPSDNANLFVVDVWKRVQQEWKLAIRYLAAAGGSGVALPGVPPAEPSIPKKY